MSRQWSVQTRADETQQWATVLTTPRFVEAIARYNEENFPKRFLRGGRVFRMVGDEEQLDLGLEGD